MLVFNCTKAATEFFSVTRQGKKQTCIEPAPHKTIAESLQSPAFPDDVDPQKNGEFQWQWVVHCLSIKRKKYLIVMDYHSRYCLTFPAGKKGDNIAFLNTFELHLKANFMSITDSAMIDEVEVSHSIDVYDSLVETCAFYQRGDRSVQGHINDVVWHLERHCYEEAPLTEEVDCLGFNLFMGQFPRKIKGNKDYIFPTNYFLEYWMRTFSAEQYTDLNTPNNIIDITHLVRKL